MVLIPKEDFAFFDPPPYMAFGAPYGKASPWMLRESVLKALKNAQKRLQELKPGWKIMLFDAYRPNQVQQFMVDREFGLCALEEGLDPAQLTSEDREKIGKRVFRLWGIPSENPATPPLHSTGGAVDVTFCDVAGREVDMGSPIDENSDRSNPDYYSTAQDEAGQKVHANRELLDACMRAEGFHRNKIEWWHFSFRDQYWAWIERETGRNLEAMATYGRADLL